MKGVARGKVEWDGTDICANIECVCGCRAHVDGILFYHYKCPECMREYDVLPDIKLIQRKHPLSYDDRVIVGEIY